MLWIIIIIIIIIHEFHRDASLEQSFRAAMCHVLHYSCNVNGTDRPITQILPLRYEGTPHSTRCLTETCGTHISCLNTPSCFEFGRPACLDVDVRRRRRGPRSDDRCSLLKERQTPHRSGTLPGTWRYRKLLLMTSLRLPRERPPGTMTSSLYERALNDDLRTTQVDASEKC